MEVFLQQDQSIRSPKTNGRISQETTPSLLIIIITTYQTKTYKTTQKVPEHSKTKMNAHKKVTELIIIKQISFISFRIKPYKYLITLLLN